MLSQAQEIQSEYYRQKLCLLGIYSEGYRPKSVIAQKCIITSLYMFHEEEHQDFIRKCLMEETDKNHGRRIVREDSQIFELRPGGYVGIIQLEENHIS